MKIISKYIDEISGREFKTQGEAIKSEKKNGGIKKMFKFWTPHPKSEGCNFANGGWAYQRKESEYVMLLEKICEAVNMYEPWIAKQYEKNGGLIIEYVKGWSFLGRYLDDSGSELKDWYYVQLCICPKCFREHGQPYHALNCTCDMKTKRLDGKEY